MAEITRARLEDLSVGSLVEIISPTGGCRPGAVYEVSSLPTETDRYVRVVPTTDDWFMPTWDAGKFRDDEGDWTSMGFHPSSLSVVEDAELRTIIAEWSRVVDEATTLSETMKIAVDHLKLFIVQEQPESGVVLSDLPQQSSRLVSGIAMRAASILESLEHVKALKELAR